MTRVIHHLTAGPRSSATVESGASAISVSWGSSTHAGNVRALNEDSLLAAAPVFVVADGMGGHEGGDVASALAVGVMSALVTMTGDIDRRTIVDTVTHANDVIHLQSGGGERSMGTTITGLVMAGSRRGGDISILNVGDSRTYRLRQGVLEQITVDHSHVQELVDAGLLDPAMAAHHPQRNVVTRALGIDPDVEVDVIITAVGVGDRFLVCSDGLSGELDEQSIGHCLSLEDAQLAADALVNLTLEHEARDNVTVIVVDIEAIELTPDADRTDPRGAITLVSAGRHHDQDVTDRRTTPDPASEPVPPGIDANLISSVPRWAPVATPPQQPTFDPPLAGTLIDDVPVRRMAPPEDTTTPPATAPVEEDE